MLRFIFLILPITLLFAQTDQPVIKAVYHGSRSDKKIALTFDACPSSARGGFDPQIVKVLVDSGVPATFFLSGKWIKKHKNEAKKIAAIPNFEIGNHTFSHPHCSKLTDDSLSRELELTNQIIKEISDSSIFLFRPPYGETNTRIQNIAHKLGFKTIIYDLASGDPDPALSKDKLLKHVTSNARNGSIIVMHVNGRGWHTAEVLPQIISSLRKKGFTFVKVSEFCK